jgi:phage gp45-like
MITFGDFRRLIEPIKRKIFLVLGRAILKAINNTEGTQKIQVIALADETITDMERFQEYGFETYPLAEAEVAAIFLNGNRDHGIALCVHDRRYRPSDLVSGEVAIYTDEDATTPFRIHLKRGRIVYSRTDKNQEVVDTEKYINSPKIVLGSDTWASVRKLIDERFQTLFNTHTHGGIDPGAGNTDVPNDLITDSHMTDKTRAL